MAKAKDTKKGSKTTNENVDMQTTENLAEEVVEEVDAPSKPEDATENTADDANKVEEKVVSDNKTVTTRFIRPRGVKDKYITGAINGKPFKVPYNETVTIPVEVDKRIMWSLKSQDYADDYIERVKSDPDEEN